MINAKFGAPLSRAVLGHFPKASLARLDLQLIAFSLLGACAYRGGGPDRPLVQKTQWFSYLNGDDIRAECGRDALLRYRFVYNARYQKQVRAYEVVDDAGGGAYLISRVQKETNLARLSSDDPLAPWRWTTERGELSPQQRAGLEDALARSGFFGAAPDGLRLDSRAFYLLAVGCRERQMYFYAWAYPSTDLPELPLYKWLMENDRTGVAFNPPFEVSPEGRLGAYRTQTVDFELTVGENGLRDIFAPF